MLQAQQDLHTDVATRSGAVTLVGHLRSDVLDDRLRLYRDPDVDVYISIRVADVVDTSSADGPGGQSMVWIRHDAVVVWHESLSASTFAPPAGAQDDTGEGGKWPRP